MGFYYRLQRRLFNSIGLIMFFIVYEYDDKRSFITVFNQKPLEAAKILLENYNKTEDVVKLMSLGNITSIKKDFSKIRKSEKSANKYNNMAEVEKESYVFIKGRHQFLLFRDNNWYINMMQYSNLKYIISLMESQNIT